MDWALIITAVGSLMTAAFSGAAAIFAARAHSVATTLNVRINGRMEQLIETAYALGVAETATKGAEGQQGVQGVPGLQGPRGDSK